MRKPKVSNFELSNVLAPPRGRKRPSINALLQQLDSPDPREREAASDAIMESEFAKGDPLAPARAPPS